MFVARMFYGPAEPPSAVARSRTTVRSPKPADLPAVEEPHGLLRHSAPRADALAAELGQHPRDRQGPR